MKKIFFTYILTGILSIACTQVKPEPFDGDIQFDTINISRIETSADVKNYDLKLDYLKPINGPEYLKDSINNATRKFVSHWFGVSDLSGLETAIDKHKKDFDNLPAKTEFGQYQIFNLYLSPTNVFQNKEIVSYAYDWYIFEGGAHGTSARWCLMFDKKDGSRIRYHQLIKDEQALLKVAEKQFCQEHGIKENELHKHYSFENNKFYLSDNFLFSYNNGLSFYYNPYEIAPYVEGLIEVNLPFELIKEYINYLDQ